ncbi:toll/interleukin-1 receptor domain-containing protein [Shewanella ulleungensis]|uniref:TIR domain-containing protein n=1 Tax=Shewanella ulleungensis TaxID=2282699 RepID=A0ABQ2QEE7_9GAMM|nr:toll/interleukin-1 receptor domain-containing protein [Shewanella ulleungensis]MCL1148887.1 toll/interleukin-1 receptor domain-containing protein [Shewanella ulleungensis]GGP74998.1 hypothetical protein GCM10009410_03660 [Shewanella ulleungensis]
MLREYLAFISYRHADNKEQGRQWATWLHQTLETYEVPEDLVGKTNSRGEVIPERIYPIFRDEEELPADSDLENSITNALKQSRLLIVLCSPNAVASTYVADEIRYFKKLGHSDRIIAAMIDGEPNASWDLGKQSAGIIPLAECFPVPLQFIVDEHGELTANRAEPIAADFRININNKIHQGWCNIEAFSQQLKELGYDNVAIKQQVSDYREQQKLMVLKIVAGILGVPLGELTQRDKAYQLELAKKKTKRLTQWLSGVVLLAVLALSAGFVALTQKKLAIENENLAQQQAELAKINETKAVQERDASLINQSRFLLEQSRLANDAGKHDLALLLGLNAIPGLYGGDRPMPRSVSEIRRALHAGNQQLSVNISEDILTVGFNRAASHVYVVTKSSALQLYSIDSGKLEQTYEVDGIITSAAFSSDDKFLAIANGQGAVTIFNTTDKTITQTLQLGMGGKLLEFSSDNATLFAADQNSYLYNWDIISGNQIFKILTDIDFLGFLYVSNNNKLILAQHDFSFGFSVFNTDTGALLHKIPGEMGYIPDSRRPFFTSQNNLAIYYNDKGTFIYDLEKGESKAFSSQIHTLLGYDGEFAITLPANRQIQGTADEIHQIESYRNNPFLLNLTEKTGFPLKHFGEVDDVYFTPDGRYVITKSYKTLRFWLKDSAVLSHEIQLPATPDSVVVSSDSQHIVAHFEKDDAVAIWKIEPVHQQTLFNRTYSDYGVELSPQGTYAYLPAPGEGEKSMIVNTSTMEEVAVLNDWCNSPYAIVFSNDDKRLFFRCRNQEKIGHILDLATVKEIDVAPLSDELAYAFVFFSPDGNSLVFKFNSYHDHDLALLNVGSKQNKPIMLNLDFNRDRFAISFSHDGGIVVAQYLKNRLVFIDAKTGTVINDFSSTEDIELFAINRDNESFFVHYSNNTTLKLSMADNRQLVAFENEENLGNLIALPNEQVALISKTGDIAVWSGLSGDFIERIVVDGISDKYHLSVDAKFLYKEGEDIAISVQDLGIFYQGQEASTQNIFIDSEQDQIVLLNGKGIKRLPAFSNNFTEQAMAGLAFSKKCLSDQERESFFLARLTKEQKLARDCIDKINTAQP